MQSSGNIIDFTGQVLIAMPGMGDPRFDRSVVYMCSHSDQGAMGLIVNKPNLNLRFSDLLEQMSIQSGPQTPNIPVHFGGPVEHGRGFVLHSRDYVSDLSTLAVSDSFAMTATQDILEDIANGKGPNAALCYNGWLTGAASPELIFSNTPEEQWHRALQHLGVDALALSGTAGRA